MYVIASIFQDFSNLMGHVPIFISLRKRVAQLYPRVLRKPTSVEVEVTLRLTVNLSVCLGVGHPFGIHDQILLFPFFYRTIALLFV
jgi:hypothetical protein